MLVQADIVRVNDMGGWYGGIRYTFTGKQAKCPVCGKPVFVEKIRQYNIREFDRFLREYIVTEPSC